MKKEEFDLLAQFLWVRNPGGLVLEVDKTFVYEFVNGRYRLKDGFSVVRKETPISSNFTIPKGQEKDYLNVEEL